MTDALLNEAAEHNVTPPTQKTLDRYGLTVEDWLTLLKAQGWVCPICEKAQRKWNTDHEHVAQWVKLPDEERKRFVRGVLCWYCNHRRVHSQLSSDEAYRIAEYIKAYEGRRDA